ncbi:MAG: fasciclin domain-containing protein [Pseudolabrys sp.]|nr:fasciclin domain-containing protein [Pseudolabrys sp.]
MRSKVTGIASVAAVVLTVVGLAIGSTFARASNQDIVDTAVGAGQFKTLAAALTAADLIETLQGPGPFTVFAPTDEAFAKLPAGTVENLLKPENKAKLTAILTYHVVPGAVKAEQVTKLSEAKTINGAMVKVSTEGGKVMINDAAVVKADIAASNGVIHVVDKVILPPVR